MIEEIFLTFMSLFFPLIVLATWSNADAKRGEVHNIALVIPVIMSLYVFTPRFIAVFVPVFVVLVSLWLILRRKGILGFADVIGIPFTLMFLTKMSIFGAVAFVGVFAYLIFFAVGKQFDRKLGRFVRNRIILLPILFLSFLVAFLVHLVVLVLF